MIKHPNRVLGDKKAIRRNFAKRRKAVLILATDIPHIKYCECSKIALEFSRLIYPSWSLSQLKLDYFKTVCYIQKFSF